MENNNCKTKKISKFGNLGLFTTEDSNGHTSNSSAERADSDFLNGLENFELVQRIFTGT